MSEALAAEAWAASDQVLFTPRADGAWTRVTPALHWLASLWPERAPGLHLAADAHPVLADFIEGQDPSRETSGVFGDGGGADVFEAARLGARLLRIERLGAAHARERTLLQRGRELLLELEAVRYERAQREVLLHAIVHDLGSPIAAVVAALDAVASGLPEASEARVRAIAQRQARRALEMTHQIVDTFREELRALDDRGPPEGTAAQDLVAHVREGLAAAASELGIELRAVRADPVRLTGDPARLERMLGNLVENALRYAPRGTAVELSATAEQDRVVVAVLDRGPGVAPEVRDRLFQRLARGPGRAGKLGLGLYSVRASARRLGGDARYEPADGGGSVFSFWTPRRDGP